MAQKKIRKVVIPAAGLGTRFLPATKAQPKEMLPIVDKPTIQYIVEEAIASGVESIIIITGKNKRAIEDHFDCNVELELQLKKSGKLDVLREVTSIDNMVNVHYIRQKHPLGLGHAVLCARDFVGDEPFGVILGDDIVVSKKPALAQLIEQYDKRGCSIVGVQRVDPSQVNKYGIIDPESGENNLYKLKAMVEKPAVGTAPSNMAILGRYIITPEIFDVLERIPKGSGGEIQLTDALQELMKQQDIYAYDFEGKRYDVGDKLGFLQATVEFALEREDLSDSFREYLKTLKL